MTTRRLAVVSAGLRQPSSTRLLADRLAAATADALGDRDIEADVEVVELREHAHALTDHLLTGFASSALREVEERVTTADGVIAVSPIFSGSYNGLFKTFFDVLDDDALTGKPVLIAATAGTARHSLALEHALRPVFTYLRAVVVPTAVFAASEDWGAGGDADGSLARRIDRAAEELAALVATTDRSGPVDPFGQPVAFEDLLHGEP